ncbi:MAG: sodium-translocating pyrophosphatase, partial [Synechococcaceae bacterium WB4_1_0192]|nr:sodium-translocating pyrophosphatase [Synechococcaceae bacterium WB4_1_0192]
MKALYKGLVVTALISVALIAATTHLFLGFGTTFKAGAVAFTGTGLFICAMIGLAVTGLLVWITEYYTGTGYRPVRSIAEASTTGH